MRACLLLPLVLAAAAHAAEPTFREIFDPYHDELPRGGARNKVRQQWFEQRLASKGAAPAIRAMAAWEKHLATLQKQLDKDHTRYLKAHAAWWGWRRQWERRSMKRTGLMPAEYPVPDALNKDFIKKEETFKRSRSLKLRERIFHDRVLQRLAAIEKDERTLAALHAGLRHRSEEQRLRCARLLEGVATDLADERKREKHPGVLAALLAAGDEDVAPYLDHPSWQVRGAAIRRAPPATVEALLPKLEGRLRDDALRRLGRPLDGPELLPGIKSHSRAVVFCVEPVGGAVAAAIERLPDGVAFGLVAIGPEPAVWKKGLTKAGPASRAGAAAWLRKRKPPDKADLHAALDAAFEFDGADTLVVVTPQGPRTDTGLFDNPLQVYYELEARLRLAGVHVHAIGRSGGAQYDYLQRFAAAFGGTVVTPG